MDALEDMLEEHITIGKAIVLLRDAARRLEKGGPLPQDLMPSILGILDGFADKCHHAKEERILFPIFAARGRRSSQEVYEFLGEHERSRAIAGALAEAVRANDAQAIAKNAEDYFELVSQHIRKENMIFPIWIKSLPDGARKDIEDNFRAIGLGAIGPDGEEQYREEIERLRKELR
jgi:hemerythrin-like domain-containing protein